jgi:hypothetical protein
MRIPSKLIACLALAPAVGALVLATGAAAAPAPAMTVGVHPASGVTSSYFTLSVSPGRFVQAGTLELHNRGNRRVTVSLDPVGALTASTLGSAYRVATPATSGQARWIVLPRRRVVLQPRGKLLVPVGIRTPAGAAAGDYLSGISVEALGRAHQARMSGNIAISSVQRYAVGVFVKVPGPRHPLIGFSGASVEREPAGLTFYVRARNKGNAILQNVRGYVIVTRGRRSVARTTIGPGTFVTGTSIAYPLLAARQQPSEGAVFRVRALMRYAGGVARLDTKVRFGHASAQRQQDFGGPPVVDPRRDSGLSWTALAAVLAGVAAFAGLVLLLLRRRQPRGARAAWRALDRALAASRAGREPLSLVRVAGAEGKALSRKVASAVRPRLRGTDRLYRLRKSELLVIAPDTRRAAAEALSSEIERHLSRSAGVDRVETSVIQADRRSPAELVARLRQRGPERLDEYELTTEQLHSRVDVGAEPPPPEG